MKKAEQIRVNKDWYIERGIDWEKLAESEERSVRIICLDCHQDITSDAEKHDCLNFKD